VDNNGVQNAGTDINYIGIQAANLVYTRQLDPYTWSLMTRNTVGDDMPAGNYYIDTRSEPVSTTAFGNMQIVLNMSSVPGTFALGIGWEMMAVINSVAGASSLPAG
jgi:hypothetical protein